MNPAEITNLVELIGVLDENGFDVHEAIEFINDSLSPDVIQNIIDGICNEYNEMVSAAESLEDTELD